MVELLGQIFHGTHSTLFERGHGPGGSGRVGSAPHLLRRITDADIHDIHQSLT